MAPTKPADWPTAACPMLGVQVASIRSAKPLEGKRMGSTALNSYRGFTRVRDWVFSRACRRGFAAFGAKFGDTAAGSAASPALASGRGYSSAPDHGCTFLTDTDGELVIGDWTSTEGGCTISAAQSVRIGRQVLMARKRLHFRPQSRVRRPNNSGEGLCDVRPVEIGDGAWLGQNVVILPGVRVGRCAVLRAPIPWSDPMCLITVLRSAARLGSSALGSRPLSSGVSCN